MKLQSLHFFRHWFDAYVQSFHDRFPSQRKMIELKRKHTHRTCKEIISLGKSLRLNAHELKIAELIALFHDLGRFKQITEYNTFSDRFSINHAQVSIQELKHHQILSHYPLSIKKIIFQSIRYHNQYQLPEKSLHKPSFFFARLVRDADKLDIWRVLHRHYSSGKSNPHLDFGCKNNHSYNPQILKKLNQKKMIPLEQVHSLVDLKLLQISWVFDIHFKPTFLLIKKRKIIEKIAQTLPSDPIFSSSIKEVLSFIDLQLKSTLEVSRTGLRKTPR